jgi:hypothetical protein
MMRRRLSLAFIPSLIAGFTLLVLISTTTANALQAANPNAAQGIEISPALVELNVEKGKTYIIKLKVTNVTVSDLVYTSTVDDFNAKNETGSPQILLDSTLPPSASIKTWVTGVKSFALKTRESRDISVQVSVPNSAEPGGHYGVLRFSGAAPDVKDTGVGLAASAGLLMLVRVDGEVTEKASLVTLSTAQNGKDTSLFETGPITFVTRIKNEGNIHVKPTGAIELRDIFGNLVTTMTVNKEKSNVLPSSIRRFETQYNQDWMIGPYTAIMTLGYGSTGQAIVGQVGFWVIPYKPLLAGLILLVTLIFVARRMLKSYNKRIIEKAQQSNDNTTPQRKRK